MSLNEIIEGRIDFIGQRLVEGWSRTFLIWATFCSFIGGFMFQSLSVTFYLFGVSTVLVALLALPPWPMYNGHNVAWLPSKQKAE